MNRKNKSPYKHLPANATFPSRVHTQTLSFTLACEYPVQDYKSYFSVRSGTLKPGMTYTKLIDTDVNVGNITSIEFVWKEHSFGRSQNKLGAEMVIDISGKYGYE